MRRALVTLLIALLPLSTHAAIAIDASTNTQSVTATSVTYALTVAASTEILFIGVSYFSGDKYTSVAYAGASTTIATHYVANNALGHQIFYLLNPATGSNNIVVTEPVSDAIRSQAAAYSGAAQNAPAQVKQGECATNPCHVFNTTFTGVATNAWVLTWNTNNEGNLSAGWNTTMRGTADIYQLGDSNGVATSTWSMAVSTGGADASAYITTNAVEFDVAAAAATPAIPTDCWFCVL